MRDRADGAYAAARHSGDSDGNPTDRISIPIR